MSWARRQHGLHERHLLWHCVSLAQVGSASWRNAVDASARMRRDEERDWEKIGLAESPRHADRDVHLAVASTASNGVQGRIRQIG